jgi:hypothetical protein
MEIKYAKEAPGPESIGPFVYVGRQYKCSIIWCLASGKGSEMIKSALFRYSRIIEGKWPQSIA